MKLEQYQRLQAAVEQAGAAFQRATGTFEAATEQIKKTFGCASFKEAEAKLLELEAEEEAARKKFETKADEFKENWKDALD